MIDKSINETMIDAMDRVLGDYENHKDVSIFHISIDELVIWFISEIGYDEVSDLLKKYMEEFSYV